MVNVFQKRIAGLQAQIAQNDFDLIAVTTGQSQIYFSGLHFHVSERPAVLLVSEDKEPAFIFPGFEVDKVKAAPIPLVNFPYAEQRADWERAFQEAVRCLNKGPVRIGVEPTAMRFLEMDLLKHGNPEISFTSAGRAIEKLRSSKDEQEIDHIRAAIAIAESALKNTISIIRPGVTEKEIASELVINLLRGGSEPELPFFPIVASGPNSANPHATPSGRQLKKGDLLIIDWGARYDGYISDITRTYAIGSIPSRLKEIYQVVQQANEKARGMSADNLSAGDIDRAVRDVIASAGFGEFFLHRTGHGFGLEAHEAPYITSDNAQVLQPGMTFTIEPGVYLPDEGGVRIEDDMVARGGSLETLTTLGRNLTIL